MYRGKLVKWDDAKGFGFIKCNELSRDTFIHISTLKSMSRKPKYGDFIYFDVVQHKGKARAINARIEGVKANPTFKISKGYRPRSNKFLLITIIVAMAAFSLQRIDKSNVPSPKVQPKLIPVIDIPRQDFSCDGRQYCSQMNSRAEVNFFNRHCPNTKMDGDNDGIPCENDSRC